MISNSSQNTLTTEGSAELAEMSEEQTMAFVEQFLTNAKKQILREIKTARAKKMSNPSVSLMLRCSTEASQELDTKKV